MRRAILILLVALIPACDNGSPRPVRADETLTVGVEADFRGFDPLRTRVMGIATLTAAITMLETLVELDAEGGIVPSLALSLEPSADHRSWIATLRRDVRFHDGTPFDAEAVAFHFRRLLDPDNACPCRGFIAPIQAVEVLDDYRVEFKLEKPWAALPAILGEPSMISLIGSPAALSAPGNAYHRHPVGTGPFVFREWQTGDRLVVDRNTDYWKTAPAAERIEFRVLPDQQSRLATVAAGDVDVIWTLQARSARQAEDSAELRVHRHSGAGARVFLLNTRSGHLADARVRRAVAHAVDMQGLLDAISDGLVPKAIDPYGPASYFACEDAAYPVYDPERARALLAAYGRPVELQLLHTATPRGRETGQVLQEFWRQVGVDVTLVPLEQVQLIGRVLRGEYEIGAWRLRDSRDPDPDLFGLFHSESALNTTGFSGPEIDRLLALGRTATSFDERLQAYCDLAVILNTEVPLIFGARNTYFAIWSDRLRGIPGLQGGVLDVRALEPAR
jgi:4-phytase/acid phosphatase/peptide/nickel transport system substrate-binding protein